MKSRSLLTHWLYCLAHHRHCLAQHIFFKLSFLRGNQSEYTQGVLILGILLFWKREGSVYLFLVILDALVMGWKDATHV